MHLLYTVVVVGHMILEPHFGGGVPGWGL